jgi:hypothetical protein
MGSRGEMYRTVMSRPAAFPLSAVQPVIKMVRSTRRRKPVLVVSIQLGYLPGKIILSLGKTGRELVHGPEIPPGFTHSLCPRAERGTCLPGYRTGISSKNFGEKPGMKGSDPRITRPAKW